MTTEEHVEATIENLLREEREFPPAPGFVQNALLRDPHIYDHAAPEEGFRAFWTEEGNRLEWMEPWTDLYTWEVPYTKWFIGGKLNVSVNCLDRHVRAGIGDRIAYYWEGEPGDTRTLTYQELLDDVCRFTNALRALGVKKGDRIAIYMPMIPELPVAMLACTRIGAAHSVVFGGFSADALAGRIEGCELHGRHHRRRRVSQGRGRTAEAQRRRGDRPHVIGRALRRRAAHRRRRRLGRRPRPLVSRSRRGPGDDRRPGADGLGGSPLPALYLGHDGEAQGIIRTTGGASPACPRPIDTSSTSTPRATSTGAWPTSVGSPATRTSCTGRWRTGRPGSSTRAPSTSRTRTDGHRLPQVPRDDPLHRADRHPGAHEVRPRGVRWRRPRRCGCSDRWKSRSTRRPGRGTGSTSAVSAARSSTPGGRPRRG